MVKPKFEKYLLTLTKTNISNIKKGKPTIIKPEQHGGTTPIYVSARQHGKLKRAHGKNKGVKLHLNDEEFSQNEKAGEGFTDLFKRASRTVKSAVEKAKPVVARVAKAAKPIVKKAVKAAKPVVKKAIASALKDYTGEEGAKVIADAVVDVGEEAIAGGKVPRGKHLSGLDATVGGKVDFIKTFKNVGRQISNTAKAVSTGYKKNVRNTPAGAVIRQVVRKGIPVAAGAAATAVGLPEVAPVASFVADQFADAAIQKAGLGVLQSNHSNFLNSMHPSMSPHVPTQGVTDIPRRGSGVYPAGKYGGSFTAAGHGLVRHADMGMSGQGLGEPMTPLLPKQGFTDVARGRDGMPVPIHQSTDFFSGSG